MAIIKRNKEISASKINCGGEFDVKISITASPEAVFNSSDIILAVDRSCSVAGCFDRIISAAECFTDVYDEISGKNRMGLLSFDSQASADRNLCSSANEIKTALKFLSPANHTNHSSAFMKAYDMFDKEKVCTKKLIMFTDGRTTAGKDPSEAVGKLKEAGTEIYIMLVNAGCGTDKEAALSWAGSEERLYIMNNIYNIKKTAEKILKTGQSSGTRDIFIEDTLNPCFEIIKLYDTEKGKAEITGSHSVQWKTESLGENKEETAVLKFRVRHTGQESGKTEVNKSLTYKDASGTALNFPSPFIDILPSGVISGEDCPAPQEVIFGGCEDFKVFDAGDIIPSSAGRILSVRAVIKKVCPGKRVAAAVMLTEKDLDGNEYKRGIKTFAVPAHSSENCQDISIENIKFILPEALDMTGSPDSMCNSRRFNVRVFAHYIDDGYFCIKNE